MKSIRKVAVACATIALAAISCQTGPLVYNKPVSSREYGDPSTSALVYGSACQAKNALNAIGTRTIDRMEMVQLNPRQKPMIIAPGTVKYSFYTAPVPVGSSLKIFYFETNVGRVTTMYYRGIQGKGPADIRVEKPGLVYLGSLEFVGKDRAQKDADDGPGATKVVFDLYPVGAQKEIDVLRDILPKFKRTAWEPLIVARIKELEK